MSNQKLPDTSLSAYESVKGKAISKHHKKILEAFDLLVWANYEQIAVKIGMERHQVGRRLSELELAGKIYKTAMKVATTTGRMAYAYAKTGAGIPKAETKPKEVTPPNTITVKEHTRHLKKEVIDNGQQNLFDL